jgi:hypothetical protein
MTTHVDKMLEWRSTTGARKAILIVEDKSLPKDSVNREVIELSKYDTSKEKWVTEETISHVEEITSFGIPESFAD